MEERSKSDVVGILNVGQDPTRDYRRALNRVDHNAILAAALIHGRAALGSFLQAYCEDSAATPFFRSPMYTQLAHSVECLQLCRCLTCIPGESLVQTTISMLA